MIRHKRVYKRKSGQDCGDKREEKKKIEVWRGRRKNIGPNCWGGC